MNSRSRALQPEKRKRKGMPTAELKPRRVRRRSRRAACGVRHAIGPKGRRRLERMMEERKKERKEEPKNPRKKKLPR